MTEENTASVQTASTKTRRPSTFALVAVNKNDQGFETFTPLGVGSTDKELMEKAKQHGNGKYAIVNVRREFEVAVVTETVIK